MSGGDPWTDTVLTYDGNDGRPVHRPARLVRTRDTLWVIATEIGPGLTIPNGVEQVWRTIRRRWPDDTVRLLLHTPGRGATARSKWEECVAVPTSTIVWYAPWPQADVILMFGHDTVRSLAAHGPIAGETAEALTRAEYERRTGHGVRRVGGGSPA